MYQEKVYQVYHAPILVYLCWNKCTDNDPDDHALTNEKGEPNIEVQQWKMVYPTIISDVLSMHVFHYKIYVLYR